MSIAQYGLTWDSHKSYFCGGFVNLQQNEEFVDMTLAADGHLVKVHKNVIALASPYIKSMLQATHSSHPVIFLSNVSHEILNYILTYVYTGEVFVDVDKIKSFVKVAKELQLTGLRDLEPPKVSGKVNGERSNMKQPEQMNFKLQDTLNHIKRSKDKMSPSNTQLNSEAATKNLKYSTVNKEQEAVLDENNSLGCTTSQKTTNTGILSNTVTYNVNLNSVYTGKEIVLDEINLEPINSHKVVSNTVEFNSHVNHTKQLTETNEINSEHLISKAIPHQEMSNNTINAVVNNNSDVNNIHIRQQAVLDSIEQLGPPPNQTVTSKDGMNNIDNRDCGLYVTPDGYQYTLELPDVFERPESTLTSMDVDTDNSHYNKDYKITESNVNDAPLPTINTDISCVTTVATLHPKDLAPQYTMSNKGALQLILNRYMYYCHHQSHGGRKRRWRCIDYRRVHCPAFIDTDCEIMTVRKFTHVHSFHDDKIRKKRLKKLIFTNLNTVIQSINSNKS